MIIGAVLAIVLMGGLGVFYLVRDSLWLPREPMKIARVFDTGKTIAAAISPDGKYVAHALADGGQQSLWIKHLATNSNVQLVPPEKTSFTTITFSKDGNYIYYVKGGPNSPLYQVPVLGGDSKKILDNVDSHISFSPDGSQFAFVRWFGDDESVLMIADTSGTAERPLVTRRDPETFSDYGVSWSPDGKFIAGSVNAGNKSMNIALIPVAGGEARMLSTQNWREIEQVAWLPDGSGLLGPAMGDQGENLTQIWFFPVSGENARLITNDLNQYAGISLTEKADRLLTIEWQNRQNIWRLPKGKSEDAQIVSNNIHAEYRFLALTPDDRVLFPSSENANGTRDIWLMNADGSGAKQLTANAGGNITPCATSDGRYVVFASNRGDAKTFHIWRINMDGTDPVQLTNGNGEKGPGCPPDPNTVFYLSGGPDVVVDKSRLWKTSINGGEATQLTDYPTGTPSISPDGRFIAFRFRFDQANPLKLGIVPITGGKPVKAFDVNLNGNLFVRWKPDGQAITFLKAENGAANIWEQPVNGGPARPATKFTAELILGFDWSRDGDLICARGYEARDPVLISNFR
jgi:Tol biopolymer transport system component